MCGETCVVERWRGEAGGMIAETCVVDGASNCIERMLRGGEMER